MDLLVLILVFLLFLVVTLFASSFPIVAISRELNEEFKKKRYFFYIPVASLISGFLPFILIILFYLVYRKKLKKSKRISLFVALYIYLTYQGLALFASSLIQDLIEIYRNSIYILIFYFIFTLLLGLLIVYINKLLLRSLKLDLALLENDLFRPIFRRVNRILVATVSFQILFSYVQLIYHFLYQTRVLHSDYLSTISLFIIVIYLACLLYVKSHQDHFINQEKIAEKEDEIRNLNRYLDKLGSLYDELRGFRHDFAGIVSSLEPMIATNDMQGVRQVYEKALLKTNRALNKEEYHFFDLKNVEDIAIRSVLATHILRAEKEHLQLSLEINDQIPIVPVPMLELIRMLNILMDNALEAASEIEKPQVTVSLVHGLDEVVLRIQNNRLPRFIDQRKIWEKGYSNKGSQRGLGLSNLVELLYQFPHVELHTEVGEDFFIQTLSFKLEHQN